MQSLEHSWTNKASKSEEENCNVDMQRGHTGKGGHIGQGCTVHDVMFLELMPCACTEMTPESMMKCMHMHECHLHDS